MTNEQKAGLINENLIRPDFGELDADDIEDGDWKEFLDPETIVQIMADISGYDVLKAQTMEMVQGNEEMLGELTEATSTER